MKQRGGAPTSALTVRRYATFVFAGALCPGGSRAWPLPGYWSVDQAIPSVTPCVPPDPTSRCVGWDVANARTACGPQYRAGSLLCKSCATGAYASEDGGCSICPTSPTGWDLNGGIAELILGVIGFGIFVYASLYVILRKTGGSLHGAASRMVLPLTWLVMSLQIVAQVCGRWRCCGDADRRL